MQTSLYDHNTLGTELKPLIPNLIFKGLIEAVIEGDDELAELIMEEYSLEAKQKQMVEWRIDLHNRNIKVN